MRQLWKHGSGLLVAAAIGLTLCGCESGGAPQSGGNSPSGANAADSGEVTIKIQSWDETEQMIAQNQGKVVVVDLWTSW
jgi:hypothetical protein